MSRLRGHVARGVAALGLLSLGLAGAVASSAQATIPPVTSVPSTVETAPVPESGDAADDPAIWVNHATPAQSLILGNDKMGALETYNLDGSLHQRITTAISFWGNVDVRQGIQIGTQTRDLAAAYNGGIKVFAIDPTTRNLTNVTDGANALIKTGGEGLCFYHSAVNSNTYVFVVTRVGLVRQFQLTDNDHDGLVEGTLVREITVGSEAEGCVADDSNGALYVDEEDVAMWRYGAEPGAGSNRTMVDAVGGTGHMVSDAEGITLVDTGNGNGYIIASDQNVAAPKQSYFTVYDRQTNAFIKAFRIGDGGANSDGCERTDGVAAYFGDLGPTFPNGVFVCQDNTNTAPGVGNQDFKLTKLETILTLPSQQLSAHFTQQCSALDCSFDASSSSAPAGRTITSYDWDFGDSTLGSGITTPHSYGQSGVYDVSLTVTDNLGGTNTTSHQVTVSSGTGHSPITYVAGASSNGNAKVATVAVPGTAAVGDQLVLAMSLNQSTNLPPDPTVVTGWTKLGVTTSSTMTTTLWTKTVVAGDPGKSITITLPATSKFLLTVADYNGVGAVTSTNAAETVSRTTHTAPAITAPDGGWVVSYWADKSANTASWSMPGNVTSRVTACGSNAGHVCGVLGDSNVAVTGGVYAARTATASSASAIATMWTIALAPTT